LIVNRTIIFVFLFFYFSVTFATNTPPQIIAQGDQTYCPLSQLNIVTSFDIIDPDDTEIKTLHIQISSGYNKNFDQLFLTGTHPNIVSTWNTTTGKLSLSGLNGINVLYTDMITAVKAVVFKSTASNVQGEKSFSFTIGAANYLPSTDHYYEYVQDIGITWTAAKTQAESRTYYGLQGYLATITSTDEAKLSGEQAAGAGWIGGSDIENEGIWKWMTGPEKGTIFWTGDSNGSTTNYANWNNSEPNNLGGEDYAHVTSPGVGIDGSWNDLSNTGATSGDYQPKGYIVEYGGSVGDPIVEIAASTRISVAYINNVSSSVLCGPGILTLSATPTLGTVNWFSSPSGGAVLGSGLTFTTPSISVTTTYYAAASVNGCIEGQRVPVTATIKTIPSIVSTAEQIVCNASSGILSAQTSQGTVQWYATSLGGTMLHSGLNFTTPIVNTTTTFYAEAIYDGCISTLRTPVKITVQNTNAPSGSILQEFCDSENATINDITIIGTSVLWYSSSTGETPLSTTELLTTNTYYASQTIIGCESTIRLPIQIELYTTVNPASTIPILKKCDDITDGDDTNGFAEFDLTVHSQLLLNGSDENDFNISYFKDKNHTQSIGAPDHFINTLAHGQTIYVQLTNKLKTSCSTNTTFDIQVTELPIIQNTYTLKNCDEDGISDGFTDFNLNEVAPLISYGNTFSYTYYLSKPDAVQASNAINPASFNNATSSIIFVRAENTNGCYRIATIQLQVSTTSFSNGYMQTLVQCDDDAIIDGISSFKLSDVSTFFVKEFPSGQNLSVHYYRNLTDAQLEVSEINSETAYNNETPFSQVLYVRVESNDNGECYGIGPHLSLIVNERPEFEVHEPPIYCLNEGPITIETFNANGIYSYEWTNENNEIISNLKSAEINKGGAYTVTATSPNNCISFPMRITVDESSVASITKKDITVTDFSTYNTIHIETENNQLGIGNYEFSLDDINGPYQDLAFFENVMAGTHQLYIRDKMGCGSTEIPVYILGFPKFFTPNNDGYNDTWNIQGWDKSIMLKSTIYIYDRFGRFIKELSPGPNGWTGTYMGKNLPASDYWFTAILHLEDGTIEEFKGHFSLKR